MSQAISEKSYVLGLDISTFCCGFAIYNLDDDDLTTAGHIPLKSIKNFHHKADVVYEIIQEIKDSTDKITHVAIEDIITKFISGKSNIKTIITLASFNAIVQRMCYELFGSEPMMMNVIRARNLADCKVPKGSNSKEYILKRVCELHPSIKENLPLMRSKEQFSKEAFDVADAVVVAKAAAKSIIL